MLSGDAKVVTIRLGAGEVVGINRFLGATIALALGPRYDSAGVGERNQADPGLTASTIVGRFGFPGARQAVLASL